MESYTKVDELLRSANAEEAIQVFHNAGIDDSTLPLLDKDSLESLNLPLGPKIRIWKKWEEKYAQPKPEENPGNSAPEANPDNSQKEQQQGYAGLIWGGVVAAGSLVANNWDTIKEWGIWGYEQYKKYFGNGKKSLDEIALEVYHQKWGNGEERKNNLRKLGYTEEEIVIIQLKVNELCKKK